MISQMMNGQRSLSRVDIWSSPNAVYYADMRDSGIMHCHPVITSFLVIQSSTLSRGSINPCTEYRVDFLWTVM